MRPTDLNCPDVGRAKNFLRLNYLQRQVRHRLDIRNEMLFDNEAINKFVIMLQIYFNFTGEIPLCYET
jgi:hypothetical protein